MSETSEVVDNNVDLVPDSDGSEDNTPQTRDVQGDSASPLEDTDNVQDIAGPSSLTRPQLKESVASQPSAKTPVRSPAPARPDPRRVARQWSGPSQKAVRISTVTPESRRNQRPLIPNPAVSESTSHVVREEAQGDNVTKAEVGEIKDTLSRQGEAIQSVAMAIRDLQVHSQSREGSQQGATSVGSTSKSKAKANEEETSVPEGLDKATK